jgi:TolB-like protein/Tfp pilus assembly protein PilF
LSGPDGTRLEISSKKGQALLAMLAVAGNGERTRTWLQTVLWGSRGADQAQASLRSELSGLRNRINIAETQLLRADHSRVWLDLALVTIDARGADADSSAEFLEGLDIVGEDGFEDWLRDERRRQERSTTEVRTALGSAVHAQVEQQAEKPNPQLFVELPAIAVLPFVNLTGQPDRDYFAEGLSEDLIDRLSRLRWLPVIARSSSFTMAPNGRQVQDASHSLGARYIFEGKLRSVGTAEMLSVSLTDNDAGRIIWSNRISLAQDASPNVIEELVSDVSAHLGEQIDIAEQQRALAKSQSDLSVRDLIWRGRWHMNRMSKHDAQHAKQLFAQALEIEPHSPEALIQSVLAGLFEVWAERRSKVDTAALRQMAQRAIIADLDDARGHMAAGIAEIWLRQPVRAISLLRHAISLNPSLVLAHAELGSALLLNGQERDAIESLNRAVRLSPNDFSLFYTFGELAMAHLMVGEFTKAAEFADKSIMRRAAYWYGHVVKINALVRNGESQGAKSALAELYMFKTGFNEEFIDWLPFTDPHWNRFLKEGLNLTAG